MAEEGDAIPWTGATLATHTVATSTICTTLKARDTMDRGPQQAVGPIAEQVTNVDEHRRRGIPLGPGRHHGDGGPDVFWREDLEAGLAGEAEQEGDGAVVRVGARAHVVGARRGRGGVPGRRVVQQAQDGARGPGVRVRGREEAGRVGGQAHAEEPEDALAEGAARGAERGHGRHLLLL